MAAQQPDMDDLLDSALADFDNLPKPKLNNKKAGARKVEANNSNGPSEEDFMKIFASAGGQGDTEGLQAELEKLAGVAGGGDMAASLADTLAQMTKETEGLSGQPTEEELNKMFSGLGMSGGQGKGQEGFDNLLPMMEGMMQSLLSKELLYPAMKELAEKVSGSCQTETSLSTPTTWRTTGAPSPWSSLMPTTSSATSSVESALSLRRRIPTRTPKRIRSSGSRR